jgi:hypothetical protein
MFSNTLTSITLAVALGGAAPVPSALAAPPGEVVGKIDRGPVRIPEALVAPTVEQATAPAQFRATLLKGKLKFVVPEGFRAGALPPGARMGTADVKGIVYANDASKQLIITGEWRTPSGVRVRDDDHVFLERARADYIANMQKALPDYEILGDRVLRIRTLGIRQTDGLSTFGVVRTLSTSLLAASGATQAVVRVMSRAEDGDRHQALVAQVITAMRAAR